jgi:hypothetical protein
MSSLNPRLLLRLEGAAVFAVSLFTYQGSFGGSHGRWLLFALLFLLPDLSMIGYALNPRVGAIMYNAVHTYVGPILLAAYALGRGDPTMFHLALIWTAHIGFDRLLGYGLKYPTRFKDTHLDPDRHALEASPAAITT